MRPEQYNRVAGGVLMHSPRFEQLVIDVDNPSKIAQFW